MNDQPGSSQTAAILLRDAKDRAAKLTLSVGDLFAVTAKLKDLGQRQDAVDLFKAWIAFNPKDPLLHAVLFNFGALLAETKDPFGSINALRESVRINPDFHPSYINLGRNLEDLGQIPMAVSQWIELVNRLSDVNGTSMFHKNMALQQLGRVLETSGADEAAEDALKQSLDLNVAQPEAMQHWIALRQRQCKWPVLEVWDRVERKQLATGISPLSLANLADDPMFQLALAYRYAKTSIGTAEPAARPSLSASAASRQGRKLRIGYVSSDLRQHAVGFAMSEVFELHDRSRFDISAYYCGIPFTDTIQDRIRASSDHWTDINGMTDQAAAAKIAADGIDILIDLNGYTKSARTKVFSLRPAPIAVNWFGFPGTMGSPYHHYVIADQHIIPPEHELYFSERVVRLPCYQPNDRKRTVAAHCPSRADEGLPEAGLVFCCLNGMQKLTAPMFQLWMEILSQVEGSALWLLGGTTETNERLRQRAARAGIAPERLVFANKKANPEHVARYALADIFLDTFPYGAHTTAADAMWMGIPIVTMEGRSFASRVCGSLVRAAGLESLIAPTPEAYAALAVDLGRDPAKLSALKAKLSAGRDASLLFDTPNLVSHLEDLYRSMWQDFEEGRLPVPNLDNLEIYHDVAVKLDLEGMGRLDDEAYRRLYRDHLAVCHATYPIRPDCRLWDVDAPTVMSVS